MLTPVDPMACTPGPRTTGTRPWRPAGRNRGHQGSQDERPGRWAVGCGVLVSVCSATVRPA